MQEMTYEQVLAFAQSWGIVYFMVVFALACAYALWPSNRDKFREAAAIPLHDEDAQ